jgi:benzoylformate decarboxylase
MPFRTGTYAFLEMLRAEGVKYIFGNPGTSEAAIMAALKDFPEIEYVLVVQEGLAVGMADAYARASGEVGFISLHIDNGLANAFSLLADSKFAGTPLVISAGNKDVRKLAEGRSDLARMAEPFCKWSVEITHPDQYPSVLRRAFLEARTAPTGPVFVSFAGNSLDDETDQPCCPSPRTMALPEPSVEAVRQTAALLQEARCPLMLVGDRVGEYGAVEQAVQVAEQLGAEVYGHTSSQVNFPTGHPQYLGRLPWPSVKTPLVRQKLAKADVILAVGCPVFSDYFYVAARVVSETTRLIHIDLNAAEIGKSEKTDLGIHANPASTLALLGRELAATMTGAEREAATRRAQHLATITQAQQQEFLRLAASQRGQSPLGVAATMQAIAEAIPAEAIVFDDSVSSGGPLHAALKFNRPGAYFGGRGGAIGWGMGGGMGLKLARPDRPVLAIVGDGSAMMTVQGLWTAVNSKIPVIYLICNNASYRVLKVNMNIYKNEILGQPDRPGQYQNMDFPVPFDFAAIGRAFGARGVRVERLEEIGPAIKEMIRLNEPAVIDLIIDGSV